MSWGEAKWIVDNVGSNVGGGFAEFETAGSHTFTVPAGVTIISITACGGGGSGGAASDASSTYRYGGTGGGGGAAVVGRKFAVTPGQTLAITVGAGGLGHSRADGGDTVIGTLLTLPGGKYGGDSASPGGNSGGDGGGCGGVGGGNPWQYSSTILGYRGNTPAEMGANGIIGCGGNRGAISSNYPGGGGGGGSLGNGGNGAVSSSVAATNGSRGGGGGGRCYATGTPGNGGDGYVRIGWGVCMD